MSKNEGKGSILLKLLILILIVVLIAVIIIPGKIWKQEESEMTTARYNMQSIYQAEKYYHRLNNRYTTNPAELISIVRQDSSLLQLQKVVNYTREIKRLLDSYKNVPYIKAILDIDQNMRKVMDDLESNRRNFRMNEDINNEAEDLKLKISQLTVATEFSNYVTATNFLDTLVTIRRDLANYSLQNIASQATEITDTLGSLLGNIKLDELSVSWDVLSKRLDTFTKAVNRSEIAYVSSVADRVADFKKGVDNGFEEAKVLDVNSSLAKANEISKQISELYQEFLNNYVVTSKLAMLRLSEEDSLVLHLTEENFYSPVTNEMYKILIKDDSTAVKVESPVLLNEFREKATPIASEVKTLPILPTVQAYLDTLEAVKAKAMAIRTTLRRNTDLFIQYKELEEYIKQFQDISVIGAYNDLKTFADESDSCESYSDMKTYVENALNGIRIYNQAYTKSNFGNLDSLNSNIISNLEKSNELLDAVRRLPKNVTKFDHEIQLLNDMKEKIKSLDNDQLRQNISQIEKSLGDLFLWASEGKTVRVYGVFEKNIENFGYIYKDSRSWEQEQQ